MAEHSQGEIPFKVQEAIKKLGYPAKEADIVKIKESLKESATLKGTAVPEIVVELSKEQKLEARVRELTIGSNRRELETKLRSLGIEPTKEAYPDKSSLAKAIAEKEAET